MKVRKKMVKFILDSLGLNRKSRVSLRSFRRMLRDKGLDYVTFHRDGIVMSRPMERDEIESLYFFVFGSEGETSLSPPSPKLRRGIEDVDEYELEILRVRYDQYVTREIGSYVNDLVKLAASLYGAAKSGALIEEREVKVMKRSRKTGRVHWKTVKAQSFDEKGRFFGKLVVRHSAEYPSQAAVGTVFSLLEQASSMFVSFPEEDFGKLEHVVFHILPIFSPYCADKQHDFKGIKFLSPLYRELLRVKMRVTKSGGRFFSLDGIKSFRHWVQDEVN